MSWRSLATARLGGVGKMCSFGESISMTPLQLGSLMVSIANRPSLGQFLNQSRELSDTSYMIALMIVILTIGIGVDAVFSTFERGIRHRRGVVAGQTQKGI